MKKRTPVILSLLVLLIALPVARWCVERRPSIGNSSGAENKSDDYYCPMHPWFHQDHPGNCGICGMTLVKKSQGTAASAMEGTSSTRTGSTERKVKFWADPMNPAHHYDHSGKAPCGMDLIPVFEQSGAMAGTGMQEVLKGFAPVDLSPWKQQLIGLRTAEAQVKPVVRVVRTVGRLAGGLDDFAAAAGDFAAQGTTVPARGRYVVADIYALDIPYVKVGQKAWVSSFSGDGNRVEGRVAQIYPYDGTQSRVRRVGISVLNLPTAELFANVEIEAASKPFLSIPSDAVMDTGSHQYVFIEKIPGVFTPMEVTVGFEGDADWQITSGLTAGETVVMGANFMVDADSKLQANFDAMDAQSH